MSDMRTMELQEKRIEVKERDVIVNNFDPDKRIDVNNVEKSHAAGYNPDKRIEVSEELKYSEKILKPAVDNPEKKKLREEIRDDITYYYDSNDNLYRVGNDLMSDNEYEINGYKYKTDESGRIISAEGDLHLKDREGRLTIKDSIEDIGKGDEKPTDDRGHLIGDQFDGSNGLENLIPQDANINRNDFKDFENELAKKVKDGKTVHNKVEPVYDGDFRRPSAIVVSYSIDGEESIRVFPNDKED